MPEIQRLKCQLDGNCHLKRSKQMTSAVGCGMIWVNPELVIVSAEVTLC